MNKSYAFIAIDSLSLGSITILQDFSCSSFHVCQHRQTVFHSMYKGFFLFFALALDFVVFALAVFALAVFALDLDFALHQLLQSTSD